MVRVAEPNQRINFEKKYNAETDTAVLVPDKTYNFTENTQGGKQTHRWAILDDSSINCHLYPAAFEVSETSPYSVSCFEMVHMSLETIYMPFTVSKVWKVHKNMSATHVVKLENVLGDTVYLLAICFDNKNLDISLWAKSYYADVTDEYTETDIVPEYLELALEYVQAVQDFVLEYMA
jgi:hypothetical protein